MYKTSFDVSLLNESKAKFLYIYFMPTVLLINGFRFFFFSADGKEPIHVHVKKGEGDGKIWLIPEIRVAYLIDFNTQEEK